MREPEAVAPNPRYRERTIDNFRRQQFLSHVGVTIDDFGPGWCQMSLRPGPQHTQQDGFVHAGILAAMADTSAGLAAFTLMDEAERVLTIEFKVNFLRPATGALIRCRATVLRHGTRISVAESTLFAVHDGGETPVAKALVTLAAVPFASAPGSSGPP